MLCISALLMFGRVFDIPAASGMRQIRAFAVRIRPKTLKFVSSTPEFPHSAKKLPSSTTGIAHSTTGFGRSTMEFAFSTKKLPFPPSGFPSSTREFVCSTAEFVQLPEMFVFYSFGLAGSPGSFAGSLAGGASQPLSPGRPAKERRGLPGAPHMCAIMLSPNSEHLICVAPSIWRAKS